MMHAKRSAVAGVLALAMTMTLAACGATGGGSTASTASTKPGASGASTGKAATATSAADMGGMSALVAAAKKEGQLNVIALPPDWADYGEILKAFTAKYGITVNSENPNGSSAQEIQAAQTNKGTDKAPDVFDLAASTGLASTQYFAPYKVAAWSKIPTENKSPDGLWTDDYTGIMSVGYDQTKYGKVTSLKDLAQSRFKGTVALNGDPSQAGAALTGAVMTAIANGGSATDLQPAITYFQSLKKAGTFIPLDPTPATVASGQTGVVIDWSFNQLAAAQALKKQGATWAMYVPDNAVIGSYYMQAINKDAPHPAAARLWEEFLYTAEAQNMYMKGGAQPVLYAQMKADGTLDATDAKNLPKVSGQVTQLTDAQQQSAGKFFAANWSKVG